MSPLAIQTLVGFISVALFAGSLLLIMLLLATLVRPVAKHTDSGKGEIE
ncbi:MAG: hypothetical protein KC731_00695 [Myxococcales bacterium]|nr:hypothetical protein [Myxococcales bacterium]MCA9629447.1 hypothetical protein [Myxococcales bacterium]